MLEEKYTIYLKIMEVPGPAKPVFVLKSNSDNSVQNLLNSATALISKIVMAVGTSHIDEDSGEKVEDVENIKLGDTPCTCWIYNEKFHSFFGLIEPQLEKLDIPVTLLVCIKEVH